MANLVLKGAVFDGENYIDDGAVVVDPEKGTIVDVGNDGEVDLPRNLKVLEHPGQTIIPGLIDTHLHFFGSKAYDLMAWVTAPESLVALRSVAHLRNLLVSGYTCVREMGSKGGAFLAQAVREGVIDGPEILSCGRSLGQTGGDDDPTNLPPHIAQELSYSYFGDGPWECRKAVRKVVRDGADFVKVYAATGSTPEPFTAPTFRLRRQFTVDELKAIVDEAHSVGLEVAGHAIGEDSVRNVVEAGVDSVEHGVCLTHEIAQKIKKRGIYYAPTLAIFITNPSLNSFIEQPDKPDILYVRRHATSDMQIAKEYGLKVVSGSDFGGTDEQPHGQNQKEIFALAKYVGNKEALLAATSRAAECCGLTNTGRIKKGYRADIVVVKGNPLNDIQALAPANIIHVLKQGRSFGGS
jgi:imidazolonepropionase-like amidohydrolase